ncbi:MAG: 3-deoxy-7-phosphoheptulonate synthase [Bdellovibrionales bacterium CG22_combo_CG10-13_8_21_14_all_38_13]|nr:MAG: 3-deoxy-7-phosphoheptulonate synthase [Bdellovibrionales bacterium CG22_combo_CG10-13_8_21_14_all_38_13]
MKLDIVPLSKWIPNLKKPLVIAGPCSAETEEQVIKTAHELKKNDDVRIFRAGIWKPRTRPNTFEGVGEEGPKWMARAKEETGLLTTTEVATAAHAELALKYGIDILWIGARTTANPFSVQEIADVLKGTNIPVLVKNPINADLALWLGAIERIAGAGIKKIGAIHRGFSSYEKTMYRNNPIWKIPIELKRMLPDLPMICDPSHIAGVRDLVGSICQKAMDIDMEGLMIETHMSPNDAWSDAAQQVTPDSLKEILTSLSLRTEFSADRNFEAQLDELRAKIDRIDQELIDALSMRKNIVTEIGKAKAENNVTPLQMQRMGALMEKRLSQGQSAGLHADYVKELFDTIHEESVRIQTELMNTGLKKD